MQSYNSKFYKKRFTVLAFLFSTLCCEVNGCIDVQTWCSTNKNFCDRAVMKQMCPETCGTCLPKACRSQCKQNCTIHTGGSIECTCFEGFRLTADGKTCKDIDECAENLLQCSDNQECQNLIGSADCFSNICTPFARDGYILSSTYEEKCCYHSNQGQCGANNLPNVGRVIGGVDARIEFWPWQAWMILGSRERCGGTLIDDSWVLTAAHCFDNHLPLSNIPNLNFTVLLGLNDTTDFTSITTQPRRIVEVIVADGYVYPKNDIALVRLERPIVRDDFVRPACLPNGEVPPVGANCYVTGFGTTNPDTTVLPKHLQQANVSIVDDEVCKNAYKDFLHPMDPKTMICAGFAEGGIDACRGDSGGPLVCQRCNSCDWYVVGATSYGRGCAQRNAYGVYARVEQFENWIASKISSVDVTKKTCESTKWGEWSQWSSCTQQCDGIQSRNRECLNGVPGIPGCLGNSSEQRSCTAQNQREWTTWSQCSATCGGGVQTRTQNCLLKGPKSKTERRDCNTQTCAHWSDWTNWSPCPNPCGRDQRLKTRTCIGGTAGNVGCEGASTETGNCVPDPSCTAFGPWSAWSSCSRTCGGGLRTSTRECSGTIWGLSCVGNATKSEACGTASCGDWSEWTQWGSCDKACGTGQRSRTRTCNGGNDCSGESTQSESCNLQACVWSTWSEWSSCTVTCGIGTRTRTRTCGSGSTNTGQCLGVPSEQGTCTLQACEVTATCSPDCVQYVNAFYCSPQYRPWLPAVCETQGCCNEPFCTNTWSECETYGNTYCGNYNFARSCLRLCGHCA